MKEIKEDKKQKDISCSQIELLKKIHGFNAIHSKIPKEFFRNRKSSIKIHMELQKIESKQISLEKEQSQMHHTFLLQK